MGEPLRVDVPGGGAGGGDGSGLGPGNGPGVGPGSDGGIGGDVFRPGGSVSAPRVIAQVRPKYTNEALLQKLQGRVVLELVVTRDGRASQVRVVRSLDAHGLDQEAVAAIMQWRFEPGRLALAIRSKMSTLERFIFKNVDSSRGGTSEHQESLINSRFFYDKMALALLCEVSSVSHVGKISRLLDRHTRCLALYGAILIGQRELAVR